MIGSSSICAVSVDLENERIHRSLLWLSEPWPGFPPFLRSMNLENVLLQNAIGPLGKDSLLPYNRIEVKSDDADADFRSHSTLTSFSDPPSPAAAAPPLARPPSAPTPRELHERMQPPPLVRSLSASSRDVLSPLRVAASPKHLSNLNSKSTEDLVHV